MIVPGEEKLSWRSVSIAIKVPQDHLDLDSLTRSVGPLTASIPIESDDVLTGQSYAFVYPLDADQEGGEHTIQVDTYRSGDEDSEEQLQRLYDSGFFSVLESCIRDLHQLQVISTTDLYYPAAHTTWRMKMLADTPRLDEFQSEIGKISLSGVKLRFSGSPHGLLESFLEISPDEDEYRCSLTVLNLITPDQLTALHRIVLNQAEEFAQLFVVAKEEQ